MAIIYATLINQYKSNYHRIPSASIDKLVEDNLVLDEIELNVNLNIHHNSTESDPANIFKIIFKRQELKNSGWRFDKINSMTI